ncbi:MAG: endonuclease/exonuclease/phosphatase family protein [Microbacterium sp.]|uniref:Endonuclease/exonuclease/phosphatase family protein n=1 Tax=Microbacterium ginsengisoli TaxID=400772 RepID=A0A0F0LX92_9MICO|nr:MULTISPECIES: endonuclease/exonuclease/phosphatase family protein [Microbacterium]MAL07758.1 endonuclease/exonuclease/phosphatase family protein [Microbacterium sp.]MCK9913182.1 endonuclease/exonuclease/phosphatase family protein [Microbacteriaceae bacterium K1510]KJL40453.1 Endonuclease/Exonuclease/phosphatase family protein [Microbacterium ginsengisoli]MBN9207841.1 endonuclease/exonuclease/phosphatase family protein [Microbacterium ginsengisoli]HAN23149.1 endonuclease/exonuclease/phosphat
MKVISYNLRKHRAAGELIHRVAEHDPDVLCLQEADTTDLPDRLGGLVLADATQRNRLGLAVYFRESTFRLQEVRAISLKKSLHDMVLKPAEERMLGVRLRDIDHNSELLVASFHAAPLTALNSLRRHQIRTALAELADLGPGLPTLMVGDYNYPVFKEKLGERVRDQGYELSLSDSRTYTRYRFFRGHYDFATSSGFTIADIRTLPQGLSDHLPILVTAQPDPARIAA